MIKERYDSLNCAEIDHVHRTRSDEHIFVLWLITVMWTVLANVPGTDHDANDHMMDLNELLFG